LRRWAARGSGVIVGPLVHPAGRAGCPFAAGGGWVGAAHRAGCCGSGCGGWMWGCGIQGEESCAGRWCQRATTKGQRLRAATGGQHRPRTAAQANAATRAATTERPPRATTATAHTAATMDTAETTTAATNTRRPPGTAVFLAATRTEGTTPAERAFESRERGATAAPPATRATPATTTAPATTAPPAERRAPQRTRATRADLPCDTSFRAAAQRTREPRNHPCQGRRLDGRRA